MANVTHGNNIIPDISMVQGKYQYYVFPSDTFKDPDGDTVTYSASGILPSGLSFAPDTRMFYGYVANDAIMGNYTITVWATSSDGTTDSLTFTLHLGPRYNNPPSISVPTSYSIDEGAGINTFLSPYTPITATDVQGVYPVAGGLAQNPYSIVWSSVNLPGDTYGVNRSTFTINSSGYISVSGEIDYEMVSQYTLLVEAKDTPVGTAPALNRTAQVVITVNNLSGMYTTYKGLAGGISILQYDQE